MIRRFFEGKQQDDADAPFEEGGGDASRTWFANTLDQVKGYGADKLEETAGRLNGALPYIERAGFRVTEIEVVMGVAPALVPHVQVVDVLRGEAREALLAEIAGRKLTSRIVGSLFRAADFGKRIDLRGFEFFEIEIEVGVIPSVKVKYAPQKRIAP